MSQNMPQNRKPALGLIVLAIFALIVVGLIAQSGWFSSIQPQPEPTKQVQTTSQSQLNSSIPPEVKNVLDQIVNSGGDPPSGYRGGTTFFNDGRSGSQALPTTDDKGRTISYREYDVHPYEKGVNRGAERIVRGSDGRAYFTSDHYRTFTRIQ